MKVIIVGASYTGIQLARSLADEESDVVLIDNSPDKVRLARNKIDCTVIQAAGNDLQVLERDATTLAMSMKYASQLGRGSLTAFAI